MLLVVLLVPLLISGIPTSRPMMPLILSVGHLFSNAMSQEQGNTIVNR
jgi:hypothetical protein